MPVVKHMTAVAKGCADRPHALSVWIEELHRYVCVDDPMHKEKIARARSDPDNASNLPLNPKFKFAVLTSGLGGVLFVIICFVATILAGKEPHPLAEYVIKSTFFMAQTAIGVALGLLGGPVLLREASRRR